jgi:hypothetical protein
MALNLTPEQVDLMAEEIAWKISGIMESAGGEEEADLLDACREIDPLVQPFRNCERARVQLT